MAETNVTEGAATEPTGTTVSATDGQTAGQSVATEQTIVNGTGQGSESFFDYESIKGKPELEAAYKEMQRAFTQKNDVFAKGRDKITQYDQFMQNPVETMRKLAQQYGYQMVQGELKADDGTPKTFNNWDEVREDFKKSIRAEIMQEIQPMFGEMQNMKKQSVEQALDHAYPDWRTYEDTMMENLQAHPTLVNDHEKLYQMSIPPEVLEARATKAALAKIQDTTVSGTIQGQSLTTQKTNKSPEVKSFDDAVRVARQEVQRRGLTRPVDE